MDRVPESATSHALLGLLCLRPMSGYALKQMISESIGHFWRESYGQIYPALRGLTERRLVEKRVENNAGKPDRHVYSITESGRETLQDWLRTPPRRQPIRDELLLRLFFGAESGPAHSREHLLTFLEAQESELKTYEQIAGYLRTEHATNPRMPYWNMTLRRGVYDSQAAIAWANETLQTLATLDRLAVADPPASPATLQPPLTAERTTEDSHA